MFIGAWSGHVRTVYKGRVQQRNSDDDQRQKQSSISICRTRSVTADGDRRPPAGRLTEMRTRRGSNHACQTEDRSSVFEVTQNNKRCDAMPDMQPLSAFGYRADINIKKTQVTKNNRGQKENDEREKSEKGAKVDRR